MNILKFGAIIDIIEKEKLISKVAKVGDYLQEKLSNSSGVKDIRGDGTLLDIETGDAESAFRL